MRVVNRDADAVIPDVDRKRSMLQKMVGLRFQEGRALFSFARPTRSPIDMLFVPAPLDIAFLDDDGVILAIQRAEPVTHDPATWRLYSPGQRYSHALEVEAGLLDRLEFAVGDSCTFHD